MQLKIDTCVFIFFALTLFVLHKMVVGWLIKALECGKKGEGSNFTLDIL
jgi:hypothetical protein